jgi:hypothetical protein
MISFLPSADEIETFARPDDNTYTPRAILPS